jgi:hypothetical protein
LKVEVEETMGYAATKEAGNFDRVFGRKTGKINGLERRNVNLLAVQDSRSWRKLSGW